MKKIVIFILVALCSGAMVWADTLIYNFEEGMGGAGTTVAGTSDVTWNPKLTSTAGDSVIAYDAITPTNDLFLINSRHNENSFSSPAGSDTSYFEFSLTVDGLAQLDLSAAKVYFTGTGYADGAEASDYVLHYRVYTESSTNLGVWTQRGVDRSFTLDTATPGVAYHTGFTESLTDTAVAGYALTPDTTRALTLDASMDLASLGVLSAGEDLKVRFMLADSRKSNGNFYSSVDDLRIEMFSVVGEPVVSPNLSNPTNQFTDANGSLSFIGETNDIQSVILNSGATASNLTVTVSAASHPEYFTILPTNQFVHATLGQSEQATNEYSIIVSTNTPLGDYTFDVDFDLDDTNAVTTSGEFVLSVVAPAVLETLMYDFQNGMQVSGATTVETTDLTWVPKLTGVGDSVIAYDDITPANDLFLINSRHNNDVFSSPAGSDASYFEFSLIADDLTQLDLSAAKIVFTGTAYSDAAVTADYGLHYRVYTESSTHPNVWTQRGDDRSFTMDAVTPGVAYNTGFADASTGAAVDGYSLEPADTRRLTLSGSDASMDLSSLGILSAGEDLKVRFMLTDSRLNNASFYSSIDNLTLQDFSLQRRAPVLSNPANVFTGSTGSLSTPGDTNTIESVILNVGKIASNLTVTVSATSHPEYFTILPTNQFVLSTLGQSEQATHAYSIVISTNTPLGDYTFDVDFDLDDTNAVTTSGEFTLSVVALIPPALDTSSVILSALEGEGDFAIVTVSNTGSESVEFTVTDDSVWDVLYTEDPDDINFSTSADTLITLNGAYPETAGVSDAIAFGFDFSFYGTDYSHFYVTSDGVIGLSNSTNTPALGAAYYDLPSNRDVPLIAPFWGDLRSPAGTLFYVVESTRVVVSYIGVDNRSAGGGSDLEFQTILYKDGRVEFRYNEVNGDLSQVVIGIQGDEDHYQNLLMTPVSGASVVLMPSESRWVSINPVGPTTVDPQQSVEITFVLLPGQPVGSSNAFTASFNWSSGGASDVAVSAAVEAPVAIYSAASSLSFTGAAGQVTSAPFTITNSGTGPLDFVITDNASSAAGYLTNNPAFEWVTIPSTEPVVVFNEPGPSPYISAADEGFSDSIPLGFGFPFYGGSYTQLFVSVNGVLSFNEAGRIPARWNLETPYVDVPEQMIAAFWGDLFLDENSSVTYWATEEQMVITWKNLSQYGQFGGSNLTFQAILRPSGEIIFQYNQLDGTHWPVDVIGLRDSADRTIRADIRQPGDWSVETNALSGVVFTQYVDFVSGRAVTFSPQQIQTIRYTPGSDQIAAGETAEIIISGDASNQSPGGETISANATLTITHNGTPSPDAMAVTFTVTNSQQVVFAAAADSDGDGMADDDERIAGTDLADPTSVFTPEVKRSALGPVLSWDAPVDGLQRTYNIYWTINLTSIWDHLATVTNGTTYLDAVHIDEPVIYYKVTAE